MYLRITTCLILKDYLQPTVADKSSLVLLGDYLPKIRAPNAKPSNNAPMMIIAVWILPAASG